MLTAATSKCIPWLAGTSLQSRLRDLRTLTEAARVTQASTAPSVEVQGPE